MIGIIKGDERFTYLAMLIKNSILSNRLADFIDVDVLILPFGGINADYEIIGTAIDIRDIIKNNSIKLIVSGNNNDKLNEICLRNNIKIIYLLNDEEFIRENAFLTARGVLYFNEELLSKNSGEIIILGYGNIGFYLAKLLKANKIDFCIYPNNDKEKKYALLEDYRVDNHFTSYRVIINTIPHNHNVSYEQLKNSKIIELASKPYGFDVLKIDETKIDYSILGSLPSKYNPYEAAVILKKAIEKRFTH